MLRILCRIQNPVEVLSFDFIGINQRDRTETKPCYLLRGDLASSGDANDRGGQTREFGGHAVREGERLIRRDGR